MATTEMHFLFLNYVFEGRYIRVQWEAIKENIWFYIICNIN